MKKIFVLIVFLNLINLVACGTTSLNGESESWTGFYSGSKDDERVREFVITPKDNKEITVPVTYRIILEEDGIELEGSKHLDSNALVISTRCSDCKIALQSDEIVIELEWEGNEEKLILTRK